MEHKSTEPRFDEVYDTLTKKYGQVYVYSKHKEFPIFYKALTRAEHYSLFEQIEILDIHREDIICAKCIVYPYNLDIGELPSGLVSDLASDIMKVSLLNKEGRKIAYYMAKEKMDNVDRQISNIIHEAFPEYDIEEIDNWNMVKTMDFLLRSEWILYHFRGRPPIDLQELINRTIDVDFKQKDPRVLNEEEIYIKESLAQKYPELNGEEKKVTSPEKKGKPVKRKKKGMSEAELRAMFPEAFTSVGTEESFKEMAMGSKNPHEMTPKELAELAGFNKE